MTDDADDLLALMTNSAARFAGASTDRARALRGRLPGFDQGVWDAMTAQGWTGVMVPEDAGGQGLTLAAACALLDPLARALLPEPLAAVAVEAAVLAGAVDAIEVLQGIAAGRVTVVAAGGTLAVAAGRLSGRVNHVPVGPGADLFLVAAPYGQIAALPPGTPGLTVTPEPRADGTYAARLDLDAVPIGMALAEGATGRSALRRARAAAVIATSAELFACMDRALEITLDYMRLREQFGRPIGAFQALQHRAVDLYIQKELARAVRDEAVAAFDAGADPDWLDLVASRAKARAGHAAALIGREAIKLHGAIGVTDAHDAGLYLRRILSLAALHGNADHHRIRCDALSPTLTEAKDTNLPPPPPEFLANSNADIDWNAWPEPVFRAGIRACFDRYYPDHLRHKGRRGTPAELRDWLALMVAKGWMAPAWPRDRGGMGLSPARQLIFIEERERAGIMRHPDQGTVMLGPMLMRHGTAAQQDHWLPRILSNKTIWCQGYSEPQAGSDLASLRTRAVARDGGWTLDGSKIWTTMAHHATHMFLLARTDLQAKKQAGLSFFLLDLATPGVTIRPIRNIAGHEEFCEVFFDAVAIPAENLVGPLHGGWTVAKSVLGFERLNNGSPRRVEGPLKLVTELAQATGLDADPVFLSRLAAVTLDVADLKSAYARFAGQVAAGESPGPEVSLLKVWAGECAQRLTEFLIEAAGEAGGVAGRQDFSGVQLDVLAPFYAMFPAQIASGTNDIQRNILATRVLGLPRS
ncbi:acyl-CoA dehydrogenase [Silicimonas algicola]|uniref:Alkylation response protein AidB-like acyl-CoA dehydrogenase n=1 Tax=Silicimonas algicola TaxID=1826607 RepID=A0A316G164_9RHOB|nr:acyl-CoA dehydrogenase [Silicimonas algicola]AZQ68275.1 acyl-CoA dehydrogenase [Silicimonas algicola]PWK54589.1 alkylation response protein AidB-like acyl-CoA dehydrogenase [Silicimonas algicola]